MQATEVVRKIPKVLHMATGAEALALKGWCCRRRIDGIYRVQIAKTKNRFLRTWSTILQAPVGVNVVVGYNGMVSLHPPH